MSEPAAIGREDAILAVKLWGLASHHYYPATHPRREDAPEPTALYAGLEGGGRGDDPAVLLRTLADAIAELAEEWEDWDHEARRLDRPLDPQNSVTDRSCPRRAS